LAISLLHEWQLPSSAATDEGEVTAAPGRGAAPQGRQQLGAQRHRPFARGTAINRAGDGSVHLCWGDSDGALHVLQVREPAPFW
jgi:hypothetical protein